MKDEYELLTRYLDGELPREALPPELQAEADAFHHAFDGLRTERVPAPPWLRSAVMSQVRAAPRATWRALLDWLVTPRVVRLTPLTGALLLAGLVAFAFVVRSSPSSHPLPAPAMAARAQDGKVTTRFVLLAPEASSVAVTGDFVGWTAKGIPLERDPSGNGLWVGVVRLKPGVHQYAFVIDGTRWQPDPNAPQLDDGYGQKNSMLLVPPQSRS